MPRRRSERVTAPPTRATMSEAKPPLRLPHNLDAERALLGALMLDAEQFVEVGDVVDREDFFDPRHAAVFAGIKALVDRGQPVDFVTLGEALRAEGRLDEIGGVAFLVDLASSATSAALAAHHARLVQRCALLRAVVRQADEMTRQACATSPDSEAVEELLDDCEERVLRLAERKETHAMTALSQVIVEAFKRLEQHRGGPTGVVSGYYELDRMLSGFNPGDMIVLAARPGMGKTALALNVIERAVLARQEALGRPATVLFFSLEMGQLEIAKRMLCSRARTQFHRLTEARLANDERFALEQAAGELGKAPVYIDDTPGIHVHALKSRARRLKRKVGLDLVVIDYLQLVSHPGAESRQVEISYISRAIKSLARELRIPVIALAQLNRGLETRPGGDRKPRLADLRESGSIEQDADVVMLLHRPEVYEDDPGPELRGLAELYVAKHRNGATGLAKLQFFREFMRFENREASVVESINA
jgi:replicative DNA helicase